VHIWHWVCFQCKQPIINYKVYKFSPIFKFLNKCVFHFCTQEITPLFTAGPQKAMFVRKCSINGKSVAATLLVRISFLCRVTLYDNGNLCVSGKVLFELAFDTGEKDGN
jgi:hypothetical protein